MKTVIFLFSLSLLLTCCKPEKESLSNTERIIGETGQLLDSILTPYVNEFLEHTDNSAALAIGITKGDDIVFAKTFGYANIAKKEKADFNTLFHIASVSKPFTAAAVMKLVQQNKLKLNDLVIDYIPEFEMQGTGYDEITIKHILTHTSGIPRHISSDDWLNPLYGPNALEENLKNVKEFELDFIPGSQFNYSNSAFDILGIVISRASGMPFTEYVETHVLKPAGMVDSVYEKPRELPQNWAIPYSYSIETQEWTPYPFTGKYAPSSGLQTTLLDMCNWGMIHVGKGSFKNNKLLEKTHFNTMVSPMQETPWGEQIGLGWFLQSYLEHKNIMHQGNDTGFESIMYVYPEDNLSIIVLANRDFSGVGRIALAASEILFGHNPKSYNISARYKFGKTMRTYGIDSAKAVFNAIKNDTTSVYKASSDDILTAGAILENGKQWKQTKHVLEFYTTLNKNSPYAYRLLGNAELNLGDTTTALNHYKEALKINPDYDKAKNAINKIYNKE